MYWLYLIVYFVQVPIFYYFADIWDTAQYPKWYEGYEDGIIGCEDGIIRYEDRIIGYEDGIIEEARQGWSRRDP